MKIAIVTNNYYPNVNGSSYFTQRLAIKLNERGHRILVIAPSLSKNDEYFYHQGIKIFGVRSFPVLVYPNFRKVFPFIDNSVKEIVENFRPDIIHLQDHFAISRAAFYAAKELGIPIIGTNHFLPENLVHYLRLPSKMTLIIKKGFWNYFLSIYGKLDLVTTPTKSAADLIKKIGFCKEIEVVSNGIDLKKFNPGNKGEYLFEKYSITRNKPILLFVGRLDKEKNIDTIIQALKIIANKTNVHLVITGIGAEQKKLMNLIKTLDLNSKVTFTGFVLDSDLPNLYAISACFVIPGEAELQSIATMEAMASGLPILAANTVALPELIDGNGYLFDPKNPDNLANLIEKIFKNDNLRRQMGQKSLEIIQKHDIEKVINKFEDIYRQIINQKSVQNYVTKY